MISGEYAGDRRIGALARRLNMLAARALPSTPGARVYVLSHGLVALFPGTGRSALAGRAAALAAALHPFGAITAAADAAGQDPALRWAYGVGEGAAGVFAWLAIGDRDGRPVRRREEAQLVGAAASCVCVALHASRRRYDFRRSTRAALLDPLHFRPIAQA